MIGVRTGWWRCLSRMGWPTLVLAVGQVMLLHPAAYSGAEVQHRLLTYRIIKEICNAARELARFPAPFFSVLPDLFVAGDDTREIHSLAPGVATKRRSMWPRTLCQIGVKGSRVLRHRRRGSSSTMPALMETRAPQPPGSRLNHTRRGADHGLG